MIVDLSAFGKTGLELDRLIIHVLGLTGRPFTKKYSQHPSYTQKRKYAKYVEGLRPWLQKEVERLGEVQVGSGYSAMFLEEEIEKYVDDEDEGELFTLIPYWAFEVTMG
jgi:hypothetical protein